MRYFRLPLLWAAFLLFFPWIWFTLVRQPDQIIYARFIQKRQLAIMLDWQAPLFRFIIAVGSLIDPKIFRNLLLREIGIFPQIANPQLIIHIITGESISTIKCSC